MKSRVFYIILIHSRRFWIWKVFLKYQNCLCCPCVYHYLCTEAKKEGFGFWSFCDPVKCSNATNMNRSEAEEGLAQYRLLKHTWICGNETNRLGCSSVQSCEITRQPKKEQKGKEWSDEWKNWLGKSRVLKLRNRVFSSSVLWVLIWQFGLCYCLNRDRKWESDFKILRKC